MAGGRQELLTSVPDGRFPGVDVPVPGAGAAAAIEQAKIPGSGTWGSTIEFYAFFPDGTYFYFPSASEVGRHIEDPSGHKAWHGQYEVDDATIRLYDASDGKTNDSDFSATPDAKQISFYGKQFTRIGDTTNLRPKD